MTVHLTTLPTGALIALGILGLLEVVLDIVALVDLYRRPRGRVTLPSKWIWVAIIVLVNLIGAILYFAVGRIRGPRGEEQAVAPTRSASEIADALYGTGDKDAPK
jgi:hypothetical protein